MIWLVGSLPWSSPARWSYLCLRHFKLLKNPIQSCPFPIYRQKWKLGICSWRGFDMNMPFPKSSSSLSSSPALIVLESLGFSVLTFLLDGEISPSACQLSINPRGILNFLDIPQNIFFTSTTPKFHVHPLISFVIIMIHCKSLFHFTPWLYFISQQTRSSLYTGTS